MDQIVEFLQSVFPCFGSSNRHRRYQYSIVNPTRQDLEFDSLIEAQHLRDEDSDNTRLFRSPSLSSSTFKKALRSSPSNLPARINSSLVINELLDQEASLLSKKQALDLHSFDKQLVDSNTSLLDSYDKNGNNSRRAQSSQVSFDDFLGDSEE